MMELNMKGIENLCNGVVMQAVKDYRRALVNNHDYPRDKEAKDEIESLERFFTGDDIRFWTKLDGTRLMEAVRDEVIEFDYDLKTLNASHYIKEEVC